MKSHLIFLLLFSLIFTLTNCKKDSVLSVNKQVESANKKEKKYTYIDTTTKRSKLYKLASTSSVNVVYGTFDVNYIGNGSYQIYCGADWEGSGSNAPKTFLLYKDGSLYESLGTRSEEFITFSRTLPPGSYFATIENSFLGTVYTATVVISAPPVVPAGLSPIFEYDNATTGRHVYTNDFEELGSIRYGNAYRRVIGYIHSEPQIGVDMGALHRVYFQNRDVHVYVVDNGTLGSYQPPIGGTEEGIMGYINLQPDVSTAFDTKIKPIYRGISYQPDDFAFLLDSEAIPPGWTASLSAYNMYVKRF